MNDKRAESDSIGTLEIPMDAYYGVQTYRGHQNFFITGLPLNRDFLYNIVKIKKAAALTNFKAGLIDEKNAARREAERCAAQGRGRRYINARLFSLGYRGEALSEAEEYLDGVDFAELCARVIERRYGGSLPAEPSERDRAVAALMRRGFSSADIRAAVRKNNG